MLELWYAVRDWRLYHAFMIIIDCTLHTAQIHRFKVKSVMVCAFDEEEFLKTNNRELPAEFKDDQKSDAYALFNASLSYMHGSWTATLWGRNLTDEMYETRGFYFGNNPANGYESELYTQKGDPRTFGFMVSYDF